MQKKQISHESIFTKFDCSANVDSLSDYYKTKTNFSQKSNLNSYSTTTLKRIHLNFKRCY